LGLRYYRGSVNWASLFGVMSLWGKQEDLRVGNYALFRLTDFENREW